MKTRNRVDAISMAKSISSGNESSRSGEPENVNDRAHYLFSLELGLGLSIHANEATRQLRARALKTGNTSVHRAKHDFLESWNFGLARRL